LKVSTKVAALYVKKPTNIGMSCNGITSYCGTANLPAIHFNTINPMNNTIQVSTNTPKNQNLANLGVGRSYWYIIFNKHLYLSGVWLGVRTDIKKDKKENLHFANK
jgi:hypothetical protein